MADLVTRVGPVTVANLAAAAGVTTTEDGWWPCLDVTWRTPVPAAVTRLMAQVRERGSSGPVAETVVTPGDGVAKIVNGVSVGQHLEVRLSPEGAPGLPFQPTPWREVTTSWDALIAALGGLNLGCSATVCGDEIEVVQEKGGGATFTVTLDAPPNKGEWIVAFGSHPSALPSADPAFTSFATHSQTIQGSYVRAVYRQAGDAESATLTPFTGSAGARGGVIVMVLSGLLGGLPALLQAVTSGEAVASGDATTIVSDDTAADYTFAIAASFWQDASTITFDLALDPAWEGAHVSGHNTDQKAAVFGHRNISGNGSTVTATTTTGTPHYGLTSMLVLLTSPRRRNVGALSIRDEGTEVEDKPAFINFRGAAVTATDDGAGGVNVDISALVGSTGANDNRLLRSDGAGGATAQASAIEVDDSGGIKLPANIAISGRISPTQITANQNDYNPASLATAAVLRLSSDASRDVTGLQGGADGRVLIVANVGAFDIVLKDDSASSTAANRFALDGDLTIAADQACGLWYDTTSSRWRLFARGRASSGGSGITQLTGDVISGPGSGSQAAAIPNNTVTYAKMQDVSAASVLLGRGSSGSGDPQEITLGAGLSMVGTTLSGTSSGGTITTASIIAPQGRLTLVTGVAVQTSDQTAKTHIYYTPFTGPNVPLFDGSNWSLYTLSGDLDLALDTTNHVAGSLYDVFLWNNSGVVTVGTGPSWSSSTSRGTGAGTTELQALNGIWTNKNSITLKNGAGSGTSGIAAGKATYVGTAYMTANGQTGAAVTPSAASGGGNAIIGVFNAYNRVSAFARSLDNGADYTYSTNTWRAARASSSHRVSWVDGLQQIPVYAQFGHRWNGSGGASTGAIGIDFDSTSAAPALTAQSLNTLAMHYQVNATTQPLLGLHYAQAMETGNGVGTVSWFATGTGIDSALVVELQM